MYRKRRLVALLALTCLMSWQATFLMMPTTPKGAQISEVGDLLVTPLESKSKLESRLDEMQFRMKGPIEPDDPKLINIIREKYLFPPSKEPYNFRYKEGERNPYISARLIKSVVNDFYADKRGGFFVEAGALDGEYMSHTLRLERTQGWQGLLVEPDPSNFAELQARNRKAWISPTCLSTHGYPETALLSRVTEPHFGSNNLNRGTAKIIKMSDTNSPNTLFNSLFTSSQCVPVSSLLTALNITHIDLFVLDVEQVERMVLETFPFDMITVDVWAIEHFILIEDSEFVNFMVSKGYYYYDILCSEVADYIFVRKESDLFSALQVPANKQDRNLICQYKRVIRRNHTSPTLTSMIRDPHHYPDMRYRETPEISPLPADGIFHLI